MNDDWEYSESDCPKCQSQMAWQRCNPCGGEGYVEDDDEWGIGEERCDECNGQGSSEWCRECGWDDGFKCFLSPEYEQEYLAKQTATGRLAPVCVKGKG